jgi:hypothetical protein
MDAFAKAADSEDCPYVSFVQGGKVVGEGGGEKNHI